MNARFSLYYRILIEGRKTHPLIFIVGTNNFIEHLQSRKQKSIRYSLFSHPSLRRSLTLFTVFWLFHLTTLFIMPRSFAKTPLTIRLTSGRRRPAVIRTTQKSIQELAHISAFVQARIRSPMTRCTNRGCARRFHPRTNVCYAVDNLHSPVCLDIIPWIWRTEGQGKGS